MMSEILAPLSQQLNTFQVAQEHWKRDKEEMTSKMTELQKMIAQQPGSMTGPLLSTQIGAQAPVDGGLGDPSAYKRNIQMIREEMREMKEESDMIEQQMEEKFKNMTIQHQKKQNLPATLTEEISQVKENLVENGAYNVQSTYERTRELVEQRLGGPFDQSAFTKDLKGIVEEARDI